METDGARQTFPCFDEPIFKATFVITLVYRGDQGYSAVSNMPPTLEEVRVRTKMKKMFKHA